MEGYLVNGRMGKEGRGFVSEGVASGGEVVVAEVSVDDECDLCRSDLTLPKDLWFSGFGLFPRHCVCWLMQSTNTENETEIGIGIRIRKGRDALALLRYKHDAQTTREFF